MAELKEMHQSKQQLIFESVRKTGKVIVVDESNPKCSLASEITSLIAEKCFDDLKAAVIKITAPHTPVPFSPPLVLKSRNFHH